jgi:4-hydroxybenzoate polyprenyltransferase
MKKRSLIYNYLSFVKFAHSIFAMPFALIGYTLAAKEIGNFSFITLLLVVLCMIFARNAAMAFNRFVDRDIDSMNYRTNKREIPAGIIKTKQAFFFIVLNSVLFVFTTYFINENKLAFYLSPVALFIILGYSYTKRFTEFSHIILGIGLGLAPIGAYIAVKGYFSVLPLIISFLVIFWVSGFDIIYSLQDYNFDKNNNLKSIPVKFGIKKSLKISSVLHLITFFISIIIGLAYNWSLLYWIGTFFFNLLLLYQHAIINENNLKRINVSFFTTNGIASIIYGGFCILDILI